MSDSQNLFPVKAYKNIDFLTTPDAREIRVLCEFVEPRTRLRHHKVRDTVVFYGSARTLSKQESEDALSTAKKTAEKYPNDPAAKKAVKKAKAMLHMSRYYEEARELAALLTDWSIRERNRAVYVATGGGPGIMEAANRGAESVEGGKSIGFTISLPFEQKPNPYITDELNFEFHYFFIRKFWFVYLAKALVIFPGGFGTLDEFFELLTLIQCKKTRKNMAVILYGNDYWKKVLNFQPMVDYCMIDEEDLNLFTYCDTPQAAFDVLKPHLTATAPH